jgi:hypothetical protein
MGRPVDSQRHGKKESAMAKVTNHGLLKPEDGIPLGGP